VTGDRWLRAVILLSGAAALLGLLSGPGPSWRTVAVFWFIGVCPGLAMIRLIGLREPLVRVALTVPVSLAVSALLSELLAIAKLWSSTGLLVGLVGATAASCLITAPSSPPAAPAPAALSPTPPSAHIVPPPQEEPT
jgi:hypothetical protein